MDTQVLLKWVIDNLAIPLAGLVALVVADVATGYASALKRGVWDWVLVANFYRTNVVPKLIGWVALASLGYVAALGTLPAESAELAAGVIGYGGAAAVALDLIHSIRGNVMEIYAEGKKPQ